MDPSTTLWRVMLLPNKNGCGVFATPHYRISTMSTRWRGGCGSGMLPAGNTAFRQLSRAGDETVATCDIAERLQRRVRAPQQRRIADRLLTRGIVGRGNADVAGAAGFAGKGHVAAAGQRNHPTARGRAACAVPRGDRAA